MGRSYWTMTPIELQERIIKLKSVDKLPNNKIAMLVGISEMRVKSILKRGVDAQLATDYRERRK